MHKNIIINSGRGLLYTSIIYLLLFIIYLIIAVAKVYLWEQLAVATIAITPVIESGNNRCSSSVRIV